MVNCENVFKLHIVFNDEVSFGKFSLFFKSKNFGFTPKIKLKMEELCFCAMCGEYNEILSIFDVIVKNKNNIEEFNINYKLSFLLVTLSCKDDTGSFNFEIDSELLSYIDSLCFGLKFATC